MHTFMSTGVPQTGKAVDDGIFVYKNYPKIQPGASVSTVCTDTSDSTKLNFIYDCISHNK